MKLAVVGANGLTGFHVVRAALDAGIDVVPVVRDDHHENRVGPLFPNGGLRYAEFESPRAMAAALYDVTHVVGSLEPRGQGPGEPWAGAEASSALVRVCREKRLEKLVMVSVVGNGRWSGFRLNRRAWRLDRAMMLEKGPWCLIRVSCYHDEVLEGHVRPPDGHRPRPVPASGQYSPVARAEAGRLVIAGLQRIPVGRVLGLGGPCVYTASQLRGVIAPFIRSGTLTRTTTPGLPQGDVAVLPEETRLMAGILPTLSLESFLAGRATHPVVEVPPEGFYPRDPPGPSSLDLGGEPAALSAWSPDLRRVVHEALGRDLASRGILAHKLDFTSARILGEPTGVHGGTFTALADVRALDMGGREVFGGDVLFVRDELAEVFEVFFGPEIPRAVWDVLDLGVRRRLFADPRWRGDPLLKAWAR